MRYLIVTFKFIETICNILSLFFSDTNAIKSIIFSSEIENYDGNGDKIVYF